MNSLPKVIGIIVISVALLLTACNSSPSTNDETDFIKLLKDPAVRDVNKSIKLKKSSEDPGYFTSRDVIYLVAYNETNNYIKFPAGSNVQIFRFHNSEKKWEEIQNAFEYYGDGRIVDPKGTGSDSNEITLQPVYKDRGIEQQLRIAVTGYVVKNGQATDEAVSAFIDFKVKP
jgi:hypothetical protein